MGYSLLINGVCWGELTHLLTIDPNFQRDIQAEDSQTTFSKKNQWLFLVPLKGGRWHIIPQLAVYTTYIPLTVY